MWSVSICFVLGLQQPPVSKCVRGWLFYNGRVRGCTMSRSKKTAIIEAIFNERYDPAIGDISNPVVSIADLLRYKPDGNVYAFFKDIVRKTSGGNKIWPASVLQHGY